MGYYVLAGFGILGFLLPQIANLILLLVVGENFPAHNVLALVVGLGGYVGAIIMGIGIFNIVSAFIHQYMGHKVTLICLLGGALLMLPMFLIALL